jgi:hypothetical protein
MFHCMVNAFARSLQMAPSELILKLGHNGRGFFPDTNVEKTHHFQEMVDVGFKEGCNYVTIELLPKSMSPDGSEVYPIMFGPEPADNFVRFKHYCQISRGVILGNKSGVGHAVYWDGLHCHDAGGAFDMWGGESPLAPFVLWREVWTT